MSDGAHEAVRACRDDLERVGVRDVRLDRATRILYSTDASIYQVMPAAVVVPRHRDELQAIVEVSRRHRLPLVPRTSGTSLAGQAVGAGLVVDMSRHLDRILEIDVEGRQVVVEPGVVLDQLNKTLRPMGLQFGPDPASADRAAFGGIVSNNSTGAHSILYGMTVDHVLDMDVVLPTGTRAHFGPNDPEALARRLQATDPVARLYQRIWTLVRQGREHIERGTPRHWRRCGGYNLDRLLASEDIAFHPGRTVEPHFNLAHLVCGAEGTLALIEKVRLGLVERPGATALGLVSFQTRPAALEAVAPLLETKPSAIELMDGLALRLCRNIPEYARFLDTFLTGPAEALLIVEYQGADEAAARAALACLAPQVVRHVDAAAPPSEVIDPAAQRRVWAVRKVGLGLLMSARGNRKPIPFIEDAAVPVQHLAAYIEELDALCGELQTPVAYYAHASAGCLHVRPFIDMHSAEDLRRMRRLQVFSAERVRAYGGAQSSEHGDGRVRSWLNQTFFGPHLYELFVGVKAAFDPDNLFNPGMIVHPEAVDAHLRRGPEIELVALPARLAYRSEGGVTGAIELCNGAGVCRRRHGGGTMCPSFRVTREEAHSTRGRANRLRAVATGRLGLEALGDDATAAAFSLCLACKACKAECPSGVDMAALKVEVLAHRHRARGVPLRDRLFANLPRLARWIGGTPLAGLVRDHRGPLRRLLKLLGVTDRRPLPSLARRTFRQLFESELAAGRGTKGEVVLVTDTFSTFFEPAVALSAARCLEALGWRVRLGPRGCCGRPQFSRGLVDAARRELEGLVRGLGPAARSGLPLICLEPSCRSMVTDDAWRLMPDDPDLPHVARRLTSFEAFIGDQDLDLPRDVRAPLLVHTHCHQRALEGPEAGLEAARRSGADRVIDADAGCCGMAGAFGYEAEHVETSRQIGELALFPALRRLPPEAPILAAGTSCRQQIAWGTGRHALHPAEWLWRRLVETGTAAGRGASKGVHEEA